MKDSIESLNFIIHEFRNLPFDRRFTNKEFQSTKRELDSKAPDIKKSEVDHNYMVVYELALQAYPVDYHSLYTVVKATYLFCLNARNSVIYLYN